MVLCIYVWVLYRLKFDDYDEYYGEDRELPIFSRVQTGYMAEYLIKLLMGESERPSSKICKLQPIGVSENATFIIDLEHVKFGDLKSDDMGSWITTGTKSTLFKFVGNQVIFTSKTQSHFVMKRRYYIHATYGKYHRMIADIAGNFIYIYIYIYIYLWVQ